MASRLKSAGPYVNRLLNEDRVHDELVEAGGHLGQVYRRLSRRKAKAVEDKGLYIHLRKGLVALRNAGRDLAEPPSHRGRNALVLVLVLVAGGAAAALANKGVREKLPGAISGSEAPHPEPSPPVATAA
jgi:hypothetical protein